MMTAITAALVAFFAYRFHLVNADVNYSVVTLDPSEEFEVGNGAEEHIRARIKDYYFLSEPSMAALDAQLGDRPSQETIFHRIAVVELWHPSLRPAVSSIPFPTSSYRPVLTPGP